jgi:hypothetical protein
MIQKKMKIVKKMEVTKGRKTKVKKKKEKGIISLNIRGKAKVQKKSNIKKMKMIMVTMI